MSVEDLSISFTGLNADDAGTLAEKLTAREVGGLMVRNTGATSWSKDKIRMYRAKLHTPVFELAVKALDLESAAEGEVEKAFKAGFQQHLNKMCPDEMFKELAVSGALVPYVCLTANQYAMLCWIIYKDDNQQQFNQAQVKLVQGQLKINQGILDFQASQLVRNDGFITKEALKVIEEGWKKDKERDEKVRIAEIEAKVTGLVKLCEETLGRKIGEGELKKVVSELNK